MCKKIQKWHIACIITTIKFQLLKTQTPAAIDCITFEHVSKLIKITSSSLEIAYKIAIPNSAPPPFNRQKTSKTAFKPRMASAPREAAQMPQSAWLRELSVAAKRAHLPHLRQSE